MRDLAVEGLTREAEGRSLHKETIGITVRPHPGG
jgi:hypothetical protein